MTPLKAVRLAAWIAVAAVVAIAGTILGMKEFGGDSPGVVVASVGGPFSLTDQDGATVTDADLKGHPSAMFFGYTSCPDVCPTTLFDLTTLMRDLGPEADKLRVYFVTVDPERDTQKVLADYLRAFDPRIVGLTGTREQIDQMLKDYRVFSRKVPQDDGTYLMDHTATVYLLNLRGTLTGTIDYQEKSDAALAKLKRLIEGA
jgi:protein SCO1